MPSPNGRFFYVDVGVEGLRYGAEYDGVQWHGPERRQHDADRRGWMTSTREWSFVICEKDDLFGRRSDVERRLREGPRARRLAMGERAWRRITA